MSGLFFARALASFFTDGSISLFTGLLLASRWLSTANGSRLIEAQARKLLPQAAVVLLLAQSVQLFLLTIEFSGATTLREALPQLRDVSTTHAGTIVVATAGASLLLFFASLLSRPTIRSYSSALLLCFVLVLRSASGHASIEGNFSIAESLQFLHLTAMAVWSGVVIVSGLLVMPGAQFAETGIEAQAYLRELSRAATLAVGIVFISGLCKSYRAAEGSISLLLGTSWGYVLLAKLLLVLLALSLGAINRRWIHAPSSWPGTALRRSAIALRLEAWCMIAILALSAALGNLSPPGTNP